ncbi:MAG: lipopolysaccharide heptosyltransferase II [Acidithiobacillus sp.]|uniref:lipopolysaccharide heptosyltransferase II n=1 Tax=Acidithiobacillus sp. TaxID=1872118 RepID=UPI003D01880B
MRQPTDEDPADSEPPRSQAEVFLPRSHTGHWNDPSRLLLIGPAWVGDMVMAQVLLQVLRRRWPRLQVDVLAPPASIPVAERMPEVRRAMPLCIDHGQLGLRLRRRTAAELRAQNYDWSICLPNSFKSALIPYWAHIPTRTGFSGAGRRLLLNDRRRLNKKKLLRTVDRFVALGLPLRLPQPTQLPAPRLQVNRAALATTLQRLGISPPQRPLVALAPGAEYGPAKRWPVHHWSTLAQALIERGYAVWIFGSPKDAEITRAIAADVPETLDLGGRTTLLEALDLLSLAPLTVSNDSGLMHVAGAVGSRVIALYGSTPLGMTPPLSARAQALRIDLPCSPCGKRECPLQHHRCMEDLRPEYVLRQIFGI